MQIMPPLRPQWVLFGDSITQKGFSTGGWAGVLADSWQRRVDVINRGYSGYNSRWATHILSHVFSSNAPIQLATVFFGANDAALPDRASAKQHVPLAEYTANIKTIIAHLQSLSVPHIILITPPPISEPHRLSFVFKTYGVQLPAPERTNDYAQQYAAACKDVAKELGLPVVDLWTSLQEVEGWQDELLCDGLHLSQRGNELVGRLVSTAVTAAYPELDPEGMRWDVPDWNVLADAEDVGAAVASHLKAS